MQECKTNAIVAIIGNCAYHASVFTQADVKNLSKESIQWTVPGSEVGGDT